MSNNSFNSLKGTIAVFIDFESIKEADHNKLFELLTTNCLIGYMELWMTHFDQNIYEDFLEKFGNIDYKIVLQPHYKNIKNLTNVVVNGNIDGVLLVSNEEKMIAFGKEYEKAGKELFILSDNHKLLTGNTAFSLKSALKTLQ